MSKGKLASLGGLTAVAVLGLSLPVCAQPVLRNITPFGDLRGASNPPVARYVAGQGLSFTFDRSEDQPQALLKFDGSGEVWALQPSPGPGGVTIYRNDVGDPVVRVTRLGGVTLYTRRAPEGVPAALLGEAQDLLPPIIPRDSFAERAAQAQYRASLAIQQALGIQRPITFHNSLVNVAWIPQFIDAFNVAADAIVKMSRERKAKLFLAKLERVEFVVGQKPDVSVNGPVITITLVPSKGFAGRPSSDRIVRASPRR